MTEPISKIYSLSRTTRRSLFPRASLTVKQSKAKCKLSHALLLLFVVLAGSIGWTILLHQKLNDNIQTTTTTSLRMSQSFAPPVSNLDKNSTGGISACLLVMDDNHFLVEWLAYHYHTLPLRYLVIANDPRSQTLPDSILNRWNTTHLEDLVIVQWNDRDFMSSKEQSQAEEYVANYFGRSKTSPDLIRHRARQRMFYYKCMKHLKEQDKDWALMIDSDEFLRANYATVSQTLGSGVAPPMTQPGSVWRLLQRILQAPVPLFPHSKNNSSKIISSMQSPCIQIPRIRFGGVMSTPDQVQHQVPSAFAATAHQFLTLQWRVHAHPDDYGTNRISKVLIDMSRIPWEQLQPVDSIHRPIKSLCGQRKLHIRSYEQLLVIHHYLGSSEQYMFRDDPRQGRERSRQQFEKAKRVQSQSDDDIRPWLQGFVDQQGVRVAKHLLKDVGLVHKIR